MEIKVTLICGEGEIPEAQKIYDKSGFAPYDPVEAEDDPQFDFSAVYSTDAQNLKRFGEIIDECVSEKINSVAIITYHAAILAILRRHCVPSAAHRNIELEHGGPIIVVYNTNIRSAIIF